MRERRWAVGSTRPRRAARDRAETAIYQRKRAPPLGALPRTRVDGSSVELAGAASTYRFTRAPGSVPIVSSTRSHRGSAVTIATMPAPHVASGRTTPGRRRSLTARASVRARPPLPCRRIGPSPPARAPPVPRSRTRPIASSTASAVPCRSPDLPGPSHAGPSLRPSWSLPAPRIGPIRPDPGPDMPEPGPAVVAEPGPRPTLRPYSPGSASEWSSTSVRWPPSSATIRYGSAGTWPRHAPSASR